MLLSAVGEASRRVHIGADIAFALLSRPQVSTVLRTKWRVKSGKTPLGTGQNKVPDFQEVLTGLEMAVWVRGGKEEIARPSLAERLGRVLSHPSECERFGALSLGESTQLVNDLRRWKTGDPSEGAFLVWNKGSGGVSLPVWADHVSSTHTRWGKFRLEEHRLGDPVPEDAWIAISPPSLTESVQDTTP